MNRDGRTRRQQQQGGFTLVELLVVIVILGILSGVVVFAVRGAGDKGAQAAIDTEARIIRTAQEAHCASHNRYAATFAELEQKKFLSSEPGYHRMNFDGQSGPCGKTGYTLTPDNPNDTLEGGPDALCGQPGGWCDASEGLTGITTVPSGSNREMVQLDSGKVLAILKHNSFVTDLLGPTTQLFDPVTGRWSPGPPGKPEIESAGALAVHLRGNSNTCGDNCGKVLGLFGLRTDRLGPPGTGQGDRWMLYDPNFGPVGEWSLVPESETKPYMFRDHFYTRAIQISGTVEQCGNNCGKVLVVGQLKVGTKAPTPPVAELYDPKTNSFEQLGAYAGSNEYIYTPATARLGNGRILLTGIKDGGSSVNSPNWAKVFDPTNGSFVDAPPPPPDVRLDGLRNPLVSLPDGTVLGIPAFYNVPAKAAIYRLNPDGISGSWTDPFPACDADKPEDQCYIYASLPDGRVLAAGKNDAQFRGETRTMFLFDWQNRTSANPHGTWRQTGSLIDKNSANSGVLLATGECASNCNKVLVAGNSKAELYTPPG